ncbi:MAG: DUF4252 domain-containing protein [Xanthomonadales bacterium]|nr:DUF4252 domain-containing protein [Xanthomonadales bacterium]
MSKTLLYGLLALTLTGCGISGNLRGNPGYAHFHVNDRSQLDRQVGLSLGPLPLRLARHFAARDGDPESVALLRGLKAVRIYVYETSRPAEGVGSGIQTTARALQRGGWEPVVAVRQDGGLARVLVRTDGADAIRGMVVMAAEDRELVLINLIGTIRPEMFNHYMRELDISAPSLAIEEA